MHARVNLRLALLSGVMIIAAATAAADDTGLTPADREFVARAAQGGMMEVAAGKLAETRAQDPAVRNFAQRMILDHTRANHSLKALADARQMPLPDTLGADDQAALGKLEEVNGAAFDRRYAELMVKDHVSDIKDFEKAAHSAKDPDVRAFADQTLPTLRHHLMLANQLAGQQNRNKGSR